MGGLCSHRKKHAALPAPVSLPGGSVCSMTGDPPIADDENEDVDDHPVADNEDGDDVDA